MMKKAVFMQVVFSILFFLSPIIVAQQQQQQEEPECGVYMAESTLGVANLGIYTGQPLHPGDVLQFPEIVVPLLFREWHEHGGDSLDGSLWDRYIWEGPVVNLEEMKNLLDTDSSKAAFIPGIGCTINSRLDLKNIESTHGSNYDTCGVHRSKHAGAGAFSPYYNSKTVAIRDIPAGSEIFAECKCKESFVVARSTCVCVSECVCVLVPVCITISLALSSFVSILVDISLSDGAEWIPDIPGAVITFDKNMDAADELLEEYVEWYHNHQDDLSDTLAEGLWNFTKHFPTDLAKVLGTLPSKPWKTVLQAVETKQQDDDEESIVRFFLRQEGMRDLEWLKQRGYCQDHLYPSLSTIPQAGRGAFATRNLPKGTIVGYSPLIHMGNNRQLWDIQYRDPKNPKQINYVQQDLILNYSFGHKESTLLLTPYGAMVNFINHSKEKANVKIVWPKKESVAHKPDWLHKDLDTISHTVEKIGLSFEYVALRDIQQDEEVFLDYGDDWQEAWDNHVRHWKPPPDSQDYKHSSEWQGPLLTLLEQETTPYPSNLVTVCKESYTFHRQTGEYSWTPIVRNSTHRILCDVVHRHADDEHGGDYRYDVQVHYGRHDAIQVQNVPPEGIELKDRLFSADWHLPHAFRHEIGIPDEMFPDNWHRHNAQDCAIVPKS